MTEENKEPSITELIEKLTESQKRIEELETSVKSFENTIKDKDKALTDKENELTKLQKILAKNFVASKEKGESDIKETSFADAYKQAIKDNMKKE